LGYPPSAKEFDSGYWTELSTFGANRFAAVGRQHEPSQPARPAPAGNGGLSTRHTMAVPAEDLAAAATDASALLVLSSHGDDRIDWLRTGEALSMVLLAATDIGLASCPINQPGDIERTRLLVRLLALPGAANPQLLLRVGWPRTGSAPLPATPRRPLREVLVEEHPA
jgi:nitroreductase